MTKYIINSGGLRNNPELAKEYFNETVKGFGKKPNILICFFAKQREVWEEKFIQYTDNFKKLLSKEIKPSFELAFPDKFTEQIKKSDAICIYGGDDHLVMYWLKQFDIPKIWEGKVVATSSAGSDALVKHFWTCDWRQCMSGLGVLPIKFIPHYESDYGVDDPRGPVDWRKAYDDLKNFGDKTLPIHTLKEAQYIVIEK